MSPCGKPSACRHVYILVEKMWAVRGWKPWGEGITKAGPSGQAAAVRLVAWKIAAAGHSRLFFTTGKGNPQAARFVLDGFTLADDQFTAPGVENYISPHRR